MKKFAIYTALIGGYDNVHQPQYTNEQFDFILFTDEVANYSAGIWQVRKVEYHNEDKTRIARYVKTHPEELLPEYAATLWIDASILITSPFIYDKVVQLYQDGVQLASVKHPYRDCIYDEAYVVYGLDTEKNIFNWCHYLRSIEYPRHNGLFESSLVYRRNDVETKVVDDMWWECIVNYSRRDQLSLNYALWKNPLKIESLLPQGEHMACSQNIQVQKHKTTSKQAGRRGVKESFWEHARCRCRSGMEEKTEQFREFHYWLYGLNPIVAKFLLHIWGVYATVVYGTIIKFRAYKRHKHEK